MLVCLPHSGAGILSQSALQLNNQEGTFPYTAGYHSSQTLALGDPATSQPLARSAQVGGAVHSYNQVGLGSYSFWKSSASLHSQSWDSMLYWVASVGLHSDCNDLAFSI